MKPTQTAIATALALVVVVFFFVFGGMSFFATPAPSDGVTTEIATTTQPLSTTTPTMPTEPVTQLMMKDDVVGTGATATAGDKVTVNYVGSFTNGTVFDASANRTNPDGTTGFTFNLGAGQVIKGWDQGVAGMKVGGKRTLIIPADLAYGSQSPSPAIPANSTLVFQVELLKVTK